jgi:hypothetical protein
MEMIINTETIFFTLMSAMLGIVAYFLKQLHTDFKSVEKDVTEVKATTALIKAEFKGINELLNQKIEFLEKRVAHFEKMFFKQKDTKEEMM